MLRITRLELHLFLAPETSHLTPNRKRKRERCSLPLPAFHVNRAAVLFDDLTSHRQTQPRAATLRGEARLKYFFQILRTNACSLIRKGH